MSHPKPVIKCCFNPEAMWSIDDLASLDLFHDLYKTYAIPVGTPCKKEGRNPIVSISINKITQILYQGDRFEKDNKAMVDKFEIWMSILKTLKFYISTNDTANFVDFVNKTSLVDFVNNESIELIKEQLNNLWVISMNYIK